VIWLVIHLVFDNLKHNLKNNKLIMTIFFNKILRRLFYILYSDIEYYCIDFSREGFLDCLTYARQRDCQWETTSIRRLYNIL